MRRKLANRCHMGMCRLLLRPWRDSWSFSSQLFASVFLKGFTSLIDSCCPLRSVLGCVFRVITSYAPEGQTLIKRVFEVFSLTIPPALSEFQLTIENIFRESIIAHSDSMTSLSKLCFGDHCLNSSWFSFFHGC